MMRIVLSVAVALGAPVAIGLPVVLALHQQSIADSPREMNLALDAAQWFFAVYAQDGMTGVEDTIQKCYAGARHIRTEGATLYCSVVDLVASNYAKFNVASANSEPNEFNAPENVRARIEPMFNILGLSPQERAARIAYWTELAAKAAAQVEPAPTR
jgi:hypothetical protein